MADLAGNAGAPVEFDAASLTRALAGRLVRESALPIRGGAVDSRKVQPGNAFFALSGERTDGHLFLADAVQRGATALVVSHEPDDLHGLGDVSVIEVADTLVALQQAAAEWRTRFSPVVIGITGSLAKTSTKEQIAEVLSERWNVLRNTANENNEIGLPLTMLRLGSEHDVAVLEMGMYQPGDIAVLAALARPSIGVVTAVRSTHLARAGSIDEIERGKRELVEALSPGGTAILNADDPRVARMASHVADGVDVVTYGFDQSADVTAAHVRSLGFEGMEFELRVAGDAVDVTMRALGRHSVHNALAAAAAGVVAGIDLPTIARGLAREWHAPHRSTVIDLGPIKVLDDSYNASPDSMIAALDLLASLPGNRRVAVLGEMLELGDTSESEHRRVEEHARQTADLVLGVGPYSNAVEKAALTSAIDRYVQPGDVVLIKGSRGAAMDDLIPVLEQAALRMAEPVA
ncbi:MAG TPA: UDP-N-acetylmuramoyl-tripeptide--D-alanyl-D-alanine ligase [Candidatus Limnocylindrales bacterium]|nr:UDP-N-acetylmuramoyl-tripeptide--D-alanyl-D-alanine ligase [Candidatus Limnocylindrales bacterium]